jgi:class 3 adenylate cyclase
VVEQPGAFPHAGARGVPTLLAVLRWATVVGIVLVSSLGLTWAVLQVAPTVLPAGIRLRVQTGLDLLTEFVALLGALVIGVVGLTRLRRWERRLREERYRVWSRERQEADRERAEAAARADAERAGAAEAILVVDLIQSTELISEHGDAFFRDLLRRIETAFIPVARQYGTRGVDGHGDGFLFCFERADQALAAIRDMFARLPGINQAMPPGVDIAFRATLHVGPTFMDARGNRTGLAVLKTVRLGGAMEMLHGRGAGRNSLVVSEEAKVALEAAGVPVKLLGHVALRGFPGTHPTYQVDV